MSQETTLSLIKTGEPIPSGIKPKRIDSLMGEEIHLARIAFSFDEIQEVLRAEAKSGLPALLVDQLGLNTLRWQLVHDPHSVSLFFIGVANQLNEPIALKDAMGTIEIEREIFPIQNDEVVVDRIRVAGIGRSSGEPRVHTVSFRADIKSVDALGVSVSEHEFPPPQEYNDPEVASFRKATSPIPTKALLARSRDTVGVVTEAMVKITTAHTRILRAWGHYYDRATDSIGLILGDVPTVIDRSLTEIRGFTIDSHYPNHIVRYTGSGRKSWAAEFPKTLSE